VVSDRLFFALWPGEAQRDALANIQRGLHSQRGRPTHPEDLHVTLVFLGELDADRRACAEEAADRVRAAPFTLTLDRLGCFPRVRVLWCGISSRPQALLDLFDALEGGLLGCGCRPERRPFAPHVTLMRKAQPLPARELAEPIAWPVTAFALVIARTGRRPRYRVVREWPLVS
jgi:2'-5' RNA ligase